MKFPNRLKITLYLLVVLAIPGKARAGSYEDLFTAITRDDATAMRSLLARGMDPNTLDPNGQTAMFVALRSESLKAADALMAGKPDINAVNDKGESALMMAALKGQMDWVKRLLDAGARVNQPGWTALHYAASGPNSSVVQLLLERGATVEAESPNKTTPLMMAARYGSEPSVDLLLAKGADLRRRNDLGLSALDFARDGGRLILAARLEKLAR